MSAIEKNNNNIILFSVSQTILDSYVRDGRVRHRFLRSESLESLRVQFHQNHYTVHDVPVRAHAFPVRHHMRAEQSVQPGDRKSVRGRAFRPETSSALNDCYPDCYPGLFYFKARKRHWAAVRLLRGCPVANDDTVGYEPFASVRGVQQNEKMETALRPAQPTEHQRHAVEGEHNGRLNVSFAYFYCFFFFSRFRQLSHAHSRRTKHSSDFDDSSESSDYVIRDRSDAYFSMTSNSINNRRSRCIPMISE